MRLTISTNQVVKCPDDLPDDQADELIAKGYLREITIAPDLVEQIAAAMPSVSAVPQRPGGLGSKLSN